MQRERLNINIKGVVAKITLLLLLACYANITLFSHAHVVDGVVMVHSHLYTTGHTDAATQSHSSEQEIEFINAIGNFTVEVQSFFTSLIEVAIKTLPRVPKQILVVSLTTAICCALPLLRAPPRR